MTHQIIKVAWDINENCENRYQLVYDELGFDDYGFDNSSIKKENPVEHAIMVKASESDESRLVG